MTRLIRGLMAIGLMASVFTAAPAKGAQQGAECDATAILTFTPGLSETPTSGTHTGREGTEECNGPIQGEQPTGPVTVDFDGRYGTRDPDTCSGGGEGWGVANHYVPTKDGTKTFRVIFTVKFGGIAGSLVSGTFDGDYYSGSFTFRPLQGDCINSPVTKAELKFKGTWHEYRSNP